MAQRRQPKGSSKGGEFAPGPTADRAAGAKPPRGKQPSMAERFDLGHRLLFCDLEDRPLARLIRAQADLWAAEAARDEAQERYEMALEVREAAAKNYALGEDSETQ